MSSMAPSNNTRDRKTTDSWITPQWVIDTFGPFDLDPCACDPQPWPCATNQYTEMGLMLPWTGMVYCNPPYGLAIRDWLQKCAMHGNAIALVFARTETEAFFTSVWSHATAIMFVKGRITFYYPDGDKAPANGGAPSVLIAYGEEAKARLLANSDKGFTIQLNNPKGERPDEQHKRQDPVSN